MKKIIYLGIFLSLVTSVCAVALATVSQITTPIIQAAQEEAFLAAVERSFPTATHSEVLATADEDDVVQVLAIFEDEEPLGFFYTKVIPGVWGPILYLVGIDMNGVFTSFDVLDHSETPGIGDVIERPEWIDRVVGASLMYPVDAISGATGTTALVSNALYDMYEHFSVLRDNGGITNE
ncbi:MAG: FMN-binding protein [Defluviitaleaceae bacterium]|nr:FMN-binding protein [Defluviitaleaceae bacterium]